MNRKTEQGKILIIVENLPVPFDTRVWQEAEALTAAGYTVSVICPKGKDFRREYELFEGVHIYRHDMPPEGNGAFGYAREYFCALREELRLARRVYREVGFDVIQGCNPPDDIYMVASWFRRRGVRYVFDHHDVCPELFEAKFGRSSGLLYRSQLWLERQTYRHAAFAFVTNESYREVAIRRGGMDPDRVIVLRSGPKISRMRIVEPVPKLRRGYPYMVGYVGVIGQQEGVEYLLRAARYVREHENNIFWGVVGDGPHLEELRRQAEEMGLGDCVEFTGRIPDGPMLEYLNTADVCVNCDEYNRMNDMSTMNKILEYMALGKPIVQFDLKEGRYSAGEASLYAERNNAEDLADKIEILLKAPERRRRMGEFGRNRVLRELSWDQTSRALLDGYARFFRGEFDDRAQGCRS
ncbi:glycosyltransferase family 4 protein [Lachnoclostridium sp. Marseille-P6806]|uniref:glycosyltransferase family 4 protein n=1 Tax=Lachnoclostridium sp. Marseille-P6806 TaxID=2364793 RepID=UPI001031E323|nr:glycosyltransferase family 4 protein [Lachnoclostridium sp. Marseille-P6806]